MGIDEAINTPLVEVGRIDYTADELLAEGYEEIPCLFREERNGEHFPVIPLGVAGIIAGIGGSNKSTFLRNMAMATTTGSSFNGWEYQGKHKSTIYVSTEDPKSITKNFIKKMNDSLRFNTEVFSSEDIVAKLEERLIQKPADLVIIDAFADVLNGKEQNSASDTRDAMGPFSNLAFKFNCTIIFLHHTNKGTEKLAVSRNNIAGSQALVNKPRFAIEFRIDKADPPLRHLCFVKHNYLPIPYYQDSSQVLRMDDNFVFTPTGVRVPFEELGGDAPLRSDGKYDKVLVDVLAVLRKNALPMTYNDLKKAIMEYRDKGERTAEKNIKHALEKKAIMQNERGEYLISRDYE